MMNNYGFKLSLIICLIIASLSCNNSDKSDNPSLIISNDIFNGSDYSDCIDLDEAVLTGNLFYVDPVNGDINNNGSSESPFSTLQEIVDNNKIETRVFKELPYNIGGEMKIKNPGAPIKGGDTIILRNGFHGKFEFQGAYNDEYINIIAEDGHSPSLSMVYLSAASKWRFRGLKISPEFASPYELNTLVHFESHGWHGPISNITIDDCTMYSVQDSSGWDIDNWNELACNGIRVYGNCMTIRNNYCKNIQYGITVRGDFVIVKNNLIENFSGDGMRGLGNDMFFEYNTVKNSYVVDENHDDGFQSWSVNDDPPRERVVLRGNVIINYEDPNQPFRGPLQGIGCFDGPYINWIVENNIVVVDHWHGISLYGAFNCRVVNNTVVDINNSSPGPSWILINAHKNGTPSEDCVIRNNIATHVTATDGVVEDHNLVIEYNDYTDLFVDFDNLNFRLTPDASAIDAGSAELAPSLDIEGNSRPKGEGYDIGAYEY
ncbi:MAG: choice-of-anchor Q domain-containing protein [Spirochaetota bacterium]|nr:choice-of-anchor Q domain-containing protein [Spirochaetota bacterium]